MSRWRLVLLDASKLSYARVTCTQTTELDRGMMTCNGVGGPFNTWQISISFWQVVLKCSIDWMKSAPLAPLLDSSSSSTSCLCTCDQHITQIRHFLTAWQARHEILVKIRIVIRGKEQVKLLQSRERQAFYLGNCIFWQSPLRDTRIWPVPSALK